MRTGLCAICLAAFLAPFVSDNFIYAQSVAQPAAGSPTHKWAIAIHGGAGESEWEHMDFDTAAAYHDSLAKALAAGTAVLENNGKALDAVEAAVEVLEDDPLFNAGRGSAFAADGANEMDAALMDGATLAAGSVAAVSTTRHPIALARAVMDHTPYVMMVGPGADAFARTQGLEQEPPSFFFTEMRWQEFVFIMRKNGKPIPPRPAGVPPEASPIAIFRLCRISSLIDLEPSARSPVTTRAIWQRQPQQAACKASSLAASATRLSSAPARTQAIVPALYQAPASASISSASRWRAKFAPSFKRGIRRSKPPTP